MRRLLGISRPFSCITVLVFSILLSACGGGGGSGDSVDTVTSGSDDTVTSAFSGSVGDGPVVGATLSIYDRNSNLIHTASSDSNANYSTRIKTKGSQYPLTIEVEDGTDLVTGLAPDFKMSSVVVHPSVKRVNVNPFTTLIVESARSMPGGLSDENIAVARSIVIEKLNFGLDPRFIADPIGADVTDENVAVMVKSSETLGEMVRRARDTLSGTGAVEDGNDIVDAIADDIADGNLDGVGSGKASGRIAAVSKLVAAQVLLEAMSNNLKVSGERATEKLDNAIETARPSVPDSALTDSVRINRELLIQARTAIEAARRLTPSIELSTIATTLAGIQEDSLPSDIERVLPGDTGQDLDQVIAVATVATDDQLDAVNKGVDTGGDPTVNNAPVISGSPATSVSQDKEYLFEPEANDVDGDTLTFSIENRPAWATFNSSSGRLRGTPTNSDVGEFNSIAITVSDGTASATLGAFSITVQNANDAPAISGTPAHSVNAGASYSFQPSASDADGDTLSFSISNRPAWASFNSGSGRLSGTPGNANAGIFSNIVISVSDGTDTSSLPAFSIAVNANIPSNSPPTIGGAPARSVAEDSAYSFQPSASDPDGDKLTFGINNRPSWASFNSGSGRLSGTPRNGDVGSYSNITITVSDGSTSKSLAPFSITVNNTNDAPSISGTPAGSVAEDSAYSFQPGASDPDGDKLTFGINNRPSWASFNSGSGRLSGTPRNGDVGSYSNITITVSDGSASKSLAPFTITVNNTNDAPSISGSPAGSVDEGNLYSFQPIASDPDGDKLTFSIQNRPAWASFNSSTGRLSGTPGINHAGTYGNIVIAVTDGAENASLSPFNITVGSTNGIPTISGSPVTAVQAGSVYDFQPSASDPDGDTLTYSVSNPPVWASFDNSTGRLSGTPASADVGTYADIVISVTDGTDSNSLTAFNITVGSGSIADSLLALYTFTEGGGSTVADVSGVGTPLDLQIQGSGNVQWLSGGGLSVDQSTLIASSGTASKIINGIKATNELTVEAWIQPADTTQTGPARIVSLSADSASRNFTLGQDAAAYDFRLRTTSTDDNGVPSLSSPVGVVSTTPTYVVYTRTADGLSSLYVNGVKQSEQQINGGLNNWDNSYRLALANEITADRAWRGVYYQVAVYNRAFSVVDVDNGFAAGTFDDSTSTQQGSISLSWAAPVGRTDGSSLTITEIAGYRVYYGASQGSYTGSVYVSDPSATSTTINNLPLNSTYYVAMKTIDTGGRESGYSSEVIKVVR